MPACRRSQPRRGVRPAQCRRADTGRCDRPVRRSPRARAGRLAALPALFNIGQHGPPVGSWRDWDPELWVDCHRRYATDGSSRREGGFARNYARMRGDESAPTLTTRFHTLGCGPFGHPVQDRALSLREGALLCRASRTERTSRCGPAMRPVAGMIGTALPVPLARAVAASLHWHLAA